MANPKSNIIVVDDDPGMNRALERLFNAADFQVMTFVSAEDLLADGAASGAACLVLDTRLPGVSGFELCRRLRNSGAESPAIFIAAYDEPASRTKAQDAGALAYFAKPVPGQTLLTAINQAISNSQNNSL